MLNIFYGRENLDKEKFIFENVGKRALIMVPDQYTMEAERQAFRHLDVSSLMDVEIVSPSGLGSYILNELGGSKRTFINKYGRHMVLYQNAVKLRDKLQVFRGMETKTSFINSVNDFISEMKQYDCGPEELARMAGKLDENSYTARKLMDIYALFSQYEKSIEGSYTDSEDRINLYLDKISKSQLIKGNEIWVYGFDSFAPKTMALLTQLMAHAADVNLVLTWDDRGRDRELFELTGIVMANAEKAADSLEIACRRQPVPRTYEYDDRIKAVKHIEKELYSFPPAKTFHDEGITLTEAAGIYNEAESAAAYVLHLVRDKGLRYRDIRLIYNDLENRGPIIERVFDEYGIPLFSDTKRDIMSSPVIKYITSLLDVVIEKYRTDTIFAMLKSGFNDFDSDQLADLENYAVKYKIKGTMWKKPFRRGKKEYGEEGLERINLLREKAISAPSVLEESFKEKTTGDFLKKFYDCLSRNLDMEEHIDELISAQEETGMTELADETARIWDSLMGILDQIYEIMGEESFEAETFRDILYAGFSQVEIGLLPPSEDGLILGNIQRSRGRRVKALIVMGLNENILPQERPTQGLFSAEEREMFRQDGKELCKVDSIRFMEERMAIYRNLSSPSHYLWMSCSLTDEEGNQMKPSSIFLKMKELFPDAEIKKDVINSSDDHSLISSGAGGMRHISRKLLETQEGQEEKGLDPKWAEAVAWLMNNDPDAAGRIKRSIGFTNRQEPLGMERAMALFGRQGEEQLILSPSRLEGFVRCPFSHMITYGLKPEERRVFEAAPREIGDIYHQCLMKMTNHLTKEGINVTDPESPWMTVTRRQCDEIVKKEIDQISAIYREGLFQSGSVEEYRRRRIADICSLVCWTVIQQVRAGHISKILPEATFGRKGQLPPLEVKTADSEIYIEGTIDRIDYLENGTVKIVDYKTGNERFDADEAAAGYRLQLMMYLKAACGSGKKPAGVFYFRIKEPSVDFSGKENDMDYLEKEIRKSFKLDGIMVDDPQVIRDIAGEFEGFSEIVPIKAKAEDVTNTGKNGIMSRDDFAILQKAIADKITEACRDLAEGRIDIHPMKTKDRSACTYCRYKGICRFDTVFEGCSYNIVRSR